MPIRMLVATTIASAGIVQPRGGVRNAITGPNVPLNHLKSVLFGRTFGHYVEFGIQIHLTHNFTPDLGLNSRHKCRRRVINRSEQITIQRERQIHTITHQLDERIRKFSFNLDVHELHDGQFPIGSSWLTRQRVNDYLYMVGPM